MWPVLFFLIYLFSGHVFCPIPDKTTWNKLYLLSKLNVHNIITVKYLLECLVPEVSHIGECWLNQVFFFFCDGHTSLDSCIPPHRLGEKLVKYLSIVFVNTFSFSKCELVFAASLYFYVNVSCVFALNSVEIFYFNTWSKLLKFLFFTRYKMIKS